MSLPRCPICNGSARHGTKGSADTAQYFRSHHYRIVNHGTAKPDVLRCIRCGHGWSPIDAEIDIEQWYASAPPDPAYMAEAAGRRKSAAGILRAMERYVRPGTLLDVGCGPGFLLAEARIRGWNVTGIEPSAWAIAASGNLGVHAAIRHGTANDMRAAPPASVDALSLIDVIEHVRYPHELVRDCAALLRSGGVLAIATPDIGSVVARVLGKRWHCIHPAHVHYFTRASLSALVTQHGFRVVHAGQYLRWFSPDYVWARIAKRPFTGGRLPPVPIPLFDTLQLLAVRE